LRAPRKRIEKTGRAAEAIASRVGNGADEVKVERKKADYLTQPESTGNTRRLEAMTAATDTHSQARLAGAARGRILLLVVSILPL
jgi:hypothetical protein